MPGPSSLADDASDANPLKANRFEGRKDMQSIACWMAARKGT
jgi:hypothetical protein